MDRAADAAGDELLEVTDLRMLPEYVSAGLSGRPSHGLAAVAGGSPVAAGCGLRTRTGASAAPPQ